MTPDKSDCIMESGSVHLCYRDGRADFSKLTPAHATAAIDRIKAQARADGYAEGVRDAANALKTEYRISSFWLNGFELFGSEAATPAACYRTILALRDKPAPAVTVQEAARVLLGLDENETRKSVYEACEKRIKVYVFDKVLRAIAAIKEPKH